MNKPILTTRLRFAPLAFLAVSVVAFNACDIVGQEEEDPATTVVTDSLQIASVTPGVGADLATTDTSFTFTFTDPVVENEYTRTDVTATGGNRHLIDVVSLRILQAKNLTPGNSIPVELEFNDDRTELSIAPQQELKDGFIYTLSVGDTTSSTGFYDARFKSEDGARFADNPNLPENLNFRFSVGIDTSQPDVPSVSFDPDHGAVNDDGTLKDGTYDYTQSSITAPLQVDDVPDNVKGYEVYYRSQNQRGRFGNGYQFRKAFDVSPVANGLQFEDSDGIIPTSALESDEFDDGELEFTATISGSPFEAQDGSYGPTEWKVRAVSINNVRGDFTDVITLEDNTQPEVEQTLDYPNAVDSSGNGNHDYIEVFLSEPLTTESVSVDAFTLEDSNGKERTILDSVEEVNNFSGTGVLVEISLEAGNSINEGGTSPDEIEIAEDVTDLAGNGIDPDNNRAIFF